MSGSAYTLPGDGHSANDGAIGPQTARQAVNSLNSFQQQVIKGTEAISRQAQLNLVRMFLKQQQASGKAANQQVAASTGNLFGQTQIGL